MKKIIRNLSPAGEFCLVIVICFGMIVFSSVGAGIRHLVHGFTPNHFTDVKQLHLMSYELVVIAAVCWISRVRGWSIATFGWNLSLKLTGKGILLLLAVWITTGILAVLFHIAGLGAGSRGVYAGEVTLPFIILGSIINPVFEEMMEVGYFVHSLKRYGMWPTVAASACLRMLLHVYAGFYIAMAVMLLGVVFGIAYWRWRQLWPLIFVHMIFDFVGLYRLSHGG